MLNIKMKNALQFILIVLVIYLYFSNTDLIISAVKDGLKLCYTIVIPSLFIFMIISSYLSTLKSATLLSVPFSPFFRLINITDATVSTYCILSIIGGFAMGGYFLEKVQNRYKNQPYMLGVLSILMTNNSPAFVILAVGAGFLGNYRAGLIIYFSLLLSSYCTAFIFSFIFPYKCKTKDQITEEKQKTFSEAISLSTLSMLNICGVVVVIFTLCRVIALYINNTLLLTIINGMLEVTTACNFIAESYGKNLYLFCLILAIFPLSASMQVKSFFKNNPLDLKILYMSKVIQVPLSLLILRVAVNLFPYAAMVYAPSSKISVNVFWNTPAISCAFLMVSISFVIFFDKNFGVFTKIKK